jgi:hypothetical protein
MLKQDDFNKAKLVEMGWRFGQSYGGGYLAGQMVMSTIANRARCGWGSWLDCMQRVPLYMAESELPPLVYPSVWEGAFVKLLHAVEGIYEGSITDLSKGALYWGDLGKIERDWFKTKIIDAVNAETGLRVHQRVADMNSLSFWK